MEDHEKELLDRLVEKTATEAINSRDPAVLLRVKQRINSIIEIMENDAIRDAREKKQE